MLAALAGTPVTAPAADRSSAAVLADPSRTLLIALDAVPYAIVARLAGEKAEGEPIFTDFEGPVPLISTFPTTSRALAGILEEMGLDRPDRPGARRGGRADDRRGWSGRAWCRVGEATTLVLDPASRALFPAGTLRAFAAAGGAIVALGATGEIDVPDDLADLALDGWVPAPQCVRHLLLAIRGAFRSSATRREADRVRREAARRTREIAELTEIGAALSTERDHDKLLRLIFAQARRVTSSDAGSLYLVEEPAGRAADSARAGSARAEAKLRFKLAQNHSLPEHRLAEFTIPIDHRSLAGYVAATGEPLLIDDAYSLPVDAP